MKRKHRNIGDRVQLIVGEVLHLLGHSSSSSADAARGRSLQLTRLEERVLMSASPMAMIAEVALVAEESSPMADTVETAASSSGWTATTPYSAVDGQEPSSEVIESQDRADTTAAVRGVELIVIDYRVQDADTLLESLLDTNRDVRLLRLDADTDGISQITRKLEQLGNASAVHLLTHGRDGEILLGSTRLNAGSLAQYTPELLAWQHSLTANADILLYGCDVAESAEGQDFVESLGLLTAADIAASDDETGWERLGGNWQFEYFSGSVEATSAFQTDVAQNWHGLLSVLTVTNTNDSGAGSLRQAILDANAASGTDTITFNLALNDPRHKYYRNNNTDGTLTTIATTTLSDVAITDFDPDFPGTPHSWWTIQPLSALPTITEAVIIDGTSQPGWGGTPVIEINGSSAGDVDGLKITGANSTIRGLVINSFNDGVVSANGDGIGLSGAGATGNRIEGNYIGTDVSGTKSQANRFNGVFISAGASGNTIGGTSLSARNLISGNLDEGVEIQDAGSTGNLVQGNYIGTDVTGTAGLGNGGIGILVENAPNNTIGGAASGARNVISGNNEGVRITGSTATGNTVKGNFIGTTADGLDALGNASIGIYVTFISEASLNIGSATSATIGGIGAGEANRVAFNQDGIVLDGSTQATIRGNSVYSNARLGLNLYSGEAAPYVTANDGGDSDSGANDLQNYPVLSSAVITGGDLTVGGTLNSTAASQFVIDIYWSESADATNHGEGQHYVGSINTTTNGSGNASFSQTFSGAGVPPGGVVSATATRSNVAFTTFTATSEFALNLIASGPANVAPVLDASMSPALAGEAENAGAPAGAVGTLVSSLVDFASPVGQVDNITDPDAGALLGIAITAADTANGSWWFSTNGGTSWTALSSVSITNARLLAADADTRLYFQPNPSYTGTIASAITFRAWDRSTGINGSTSAAGSLAWIRDNFTSDFYSNNDGTVNWTGSWIENDDGGSGAGGGNLYVNGGKLRIEANHTGDWIYREVNLSGAVSAKLMFNYDNSLEGSDRIDVQVSGNGGGTYTTVSGGSFTQSLNTGSSAASFDITPYISANTRIRFLVASTGGNKDLKLDNILVESVTPGGSTAFSVLSDTAAITVEANVAPVISSDGGGVSATVNVAENSVAVTTVTAADANLPAQTLTYSINGGLDAAKFSINSSTGALSFIAAPNFEIPTDNGGNNVYDVIVQVSDGSLTDTQALAVTVTAVNEAPVNSVPGTQTTPQDTPLLFKLANSNVISIGDVDAGGNPIEVTLTASNGTITLGWPSATATAAGGEVPVNTVTADRQVTHDTTNDINGPRAVAADPAGNYVVTWSSNLQDGDGWGIYAQRFNASGAAQGGAFLVNGTITKDQVYSTVAMDDAGEFVIVWSTQDQDGNGWGVYAQRYNAAGVAQGSEFKVNTYTNSDQLGASVSMDRGGNFVVTWSSKDQDGDGWGVYGHRFDSAGIAQGGEFRVNVTTSKDQTASSVAMDDSGDFVVTWSSLDQDGNSWGIYAKRYSASGIPQGGEFRVNTATAQEQQYSSVAMDAAGNFVVTWSSKDQDGDTWGVYAQRYDAAGLPLGSEFRVNVITAKEQMHSSVAMDVDGDFVISWTSIDQDGNAAGVYARQYTASGAAKGGDTLVNTTTSGDQHFSSVAMDARGDFIVVWTGNGVGDTLGVFGRRFTVPTVLTFVTGDGTHDTTMTFRGTLSDVNTVLNGMSFTPTSGFNGLGTVTITSGDLGSSGSGGPQSDSDTVIINVGTSNVAPTFTIAGGTLNYTENDPATVIAPGAGITDPDSASFDGGQLTAFFSAGGTADDQITIQNQGMGAGQIGVSGASVTYAGTTIGSFAGGGDGVTPLVVSLNSNATQAAVTALARNLTYQNMSNNPGTLPRTVQFAVTDGDGGTSNSASVNIVMTAVNDVPVTADEAYSVDEDNSLTIPVAGVLGNDTDAEGVLLTAVTVTGPANGGLSLSADGSFTYTPNLNFNGTDSFTYLASDGTADSAPATVTITVNPINDAPLIASNGGGPTAAVSVDENSTAVTTVTATDADLPAQTMTYSISGGADAAIFTINSSSGALSFVSAPDYESPGDAGANNIYDVIVQVSDGGLIDTQAIQVRVYGDHPVNIVTADTRTEADVATDTYGNYVVVWASQSQDGSGWGIFGRRFDANGNALSSEFQINSASAGDQFDPAVAMDATGNFVVTWTSLGQSGDAAADGNIYARRYNAAGVAQGSEFLVNPTTAGDQREAAVAYEGKDGHFLVVWASNGQDGSGWGVYGQEFDGSGNVADAQFRANSTTAGDQRAPDVGGDTYGEWAITWQSFAQDGSGWGIFSQFFRESGNSLGPQRQLNQTTSGNQYAPALMVEDDGDYVVSWVSDGQDGSGSTVVAAYVLYGGGANNVKPEFVVNTTLTGDQSAPDIASQPDGNFVVTWMSTGQDGDGPSESNLYGRVFEAHNGGPVATGNEFLINTMTTGSQQFPAVAADDEGDFVVAWNGQGLTDSDGIYSRLFRNLLTSFAPSVTLADTPLTFTENGAALSIDSALTVTDSDSANLTGATITISDGFVAGQDDLLFTNQLGITGTYDAVSGVLTMTGTTTVANYQTALRTVSYRNTSDTPVVVTRTIGFSATDGTASGSDRRDVNVVPVNDAPVANADSYSTSEETPLNIAAAGVLANDTDVEGNPLTVSLVDGVSNGALTLNADGSFTYTPNADFSGSDSFRYRATDTSGAISLAIVTLTVTPVNDAPVITSNGGGLTAAVSIVENSTTLTTVTGTDADVPAQTLTYSISGGADAASFTINSSTGALSFASAPDFEAPADSGADNVYDVNVQVTDGTLTDTQAIAVTVTAVNDNNPVITSNGGAATAAVSVAENATAVATVSATDADLPGQTLSYSISGGADAASFTINSTTGALSFASAPDFEAPADSGADNVYDVTVQVTDGTLTDTQAIAVTVTSVNDNNPVITSNGGAATAAVSVAENSTAVTTVFATDADQPVQSLTYSIAGGADAANFTINSTTGVLSLLTTPDFETPADSGANNIYDVIVEVSDGTLSGTQSISVRVTDVNEASTAESGGPYAISEGDTLTVVAGQCIDPEGQPLMYAWDIDSDGVFTDATGSTATLTWSQLNSLASPIHDQGARTIALRVTDAGGISTVATTTLAVINTAPTVNVTGNATTSSGTPYVINFSTTDPGSDTITTYRVNWGDGTTEYISGTAASATHTFLTPGGTRNIAVLAIDEDGSFPMNGGQLVVTVLNTAPSSPTLSDSVVPGQINGAVVGTLNFTDPDSGDAHTWTVSDSRFTVVGSILKLKPGLQLNPVTEPTVAITVTVTDASGASGTASFTLRVNNPPVSAGDAYAVDGTQQLSISSPSLGVLANDIDPDGDAFSASLISGPSHAATFGLNADGTFWYRAAAGYSGVDTFLYRVNDGENPGTVTTVTLAVNQPASLTYTSLVSTVPEQSALSAPLKVGTLTIVDDGFGTNMLTVTGTDAALFALDSDHNLFLKAGLTIDYAVQTRFDVTVLLDDVAIAGTPDASRSQVINVQNINDAPIASALPNVLVLEDASPGTISTASAFIDNDGDALNYAVQVVSQTPGLIRTISINQTTGVISYSLSGNAHGAATLRVTGKDPSNASASAEFQLIVQPVNDAPVAVGYFGSTLRGQTLTTAAVGVLSSVSDVELDPLTVTLVSSPANGSVALQANGFFVYTPNAGFQGTDTFNFVASDGTLLSNVGTATISVQPQFIGLLLGSSSSTSGFGTPASTGTIETSEATGSTSSGSGTANNSGAGNTGATNSQSGTGSGSSAGATNGVGTVALLQGGLNLTLSASESESADIDKNALIGFLQLQEEVSTKRLNVTASQNSFESEDRNTSNDLMKRANAALASHNFDATFNQSGRTSESFSVDTAREAFYKQLAGRVDKQSDTVAEQLEKSEKLKGRVVGSVGVVTTGFSVGYLFWAVRLGTLASGLLAQVPAWAMLDPLLVIDGDQRENDDKESLQNIIDRQQAKVNKEQIQHETDHTAET